MGPSCDELELLEEYRRTAFIFDARGRMIQESAPDRSRGKRFSLTGCRRGNLAVIRDDVVDQAATELERLTASEPPLWPADTAPRNGRGFLGALGVPGPVVDENGGLLWFFPEPLAFDAGVHLVWSGTEGAERLVNRFPEGIARSLVETGFRTSGDLWEPWCVAVVEGSVVSIAETVRRGPNGAEVGVDTASGHRGRGLGAATTAGWSRHRDLEGITLFYSTGRMNMSSRRVSERLNLRLLGSTFAVP
jgi:hypothetical protein